MLKRRKVLVENIEKAVETTKKFDAFFKLQDDFKVESSPARGLGSLIVYLIIIVLVILELGYYFDERFVYSYEVDIDHSSKLKLNVDITVSMTCDQISADVVDTTSKNALSNKDISKEDTWFEMSPNQKNNHNAITTIYEKIRNNYHALHSILWLSYGNIPNSLGQRESLPNTKFDACRIHGTYELNKVSGNFHVMPGKSASVMGGHAHVIPMFGNTQFNFSHRIDDFSFGDNSHLVHNALNFDLKIAENFQTEYQYYISVVSTLIHSKETYQYSVAESIKNIDHDHGSHGASGISFKYDITPLKVKVKLSRMSTFELIISLIGIVGGIFSTSIMFNSFYQVFSGIYYKARDQN